MHGHCQFRSLLRSLSQGFPSQQREANACAAGPAKAPGEMNEQITDVFRGHCQQYAAV